MSPPPVPADHEPQCRQLPLLNPQWPETSSSWAPADILQKKNGATGPSWPVITIFTYPSLSLPSSLSLTLCFLKLLNEWGPDFRGPRPCKSGFPGIPFTQPGLVSPAFLPLWPDASSHGFLTKAVPLSHSQHKPPFGSTVVPLWEYSLSPWLLPGESEKFFCFVAWPSLAFASVI